MTLPTIISLVGKYFISGHNGLLRGRIIGQLLNAEYPYYVAEIYAREDGDLTIRTQTIVNLDHLSMCQLFDEREFWILEWERAVAQFKAAEAEQQRRREERKRAKEAAERGERSARGDATRDAAEELLRRAGVSIIRLQGNE